MRNFDVIAIFDFTFQEDPEIVFERQITPKCLEQDGQLGHNHELELNGLNSIADWKSGIGNT